MIFNLIVATGTSGEIGIGNNLLGRFPVDMEYFKQKTRNSVVIMGRKTFNSLQIKPLPGRKNIVITKNRSFQYEGVRNAYSVEQAVEIAKDQEAHYKQAFVIGGAEIYQEFLDKSLIDRIYLTKINKSFDQADKFIDLPEYWQEISKFSAFAYGLKFDFITLEP